MLRAAVVAALGFTALLVAVLTEWAPLARLDLVMSEAFRGYGEAHPGWVGVLRVATDLAATVPVLVVGLAIATVLVVRGERYRALVTVVVVLAIPLLWVLAHWVVYRPRPSDGFVQVAAYGFPSGHTGNATALALLAVWLLWPRLARRGRVVLVVAAAAFAGFIGLTRVALLAHWPSDVLAAWLLTLAVFPLLTSLLRPAARRVTPRVAATCWPDPPRRWPPDPARE